MGDDGWGAGDEGLGKAAHGAGEEAEEGGDGEDDADYEEEPVRMEVSKTRAIMMEVDDDKDTKLAVKAWRNLDSHPYSASRNLLMRRLKCSSHACRCLTKCFTGGKLYIKVFLQTTPLVLKHFHSNSRDM